MRSAPAVQVVVGGDRGWHLAAAVSCAAAAAVLAAWLALMVEAPVPVVAVSAAITALAGAAVSHRLLPAPAGVLAWDGAEWHWGGSPGQVAVVIDVGPWMLLHFVPSARLGGRPAHLPVARSAARAHWHGLRTAVYSRRPEPRTPSAPRM